jgi:hypothetical protein
VKRIAPLELFIIGAIHFVHCTLRIYPLCLFIVAVVMAATSLPHKSLPPSNKDAIATPFQPIYPLTNKFIGQHLIVFLSATSIKNSGQKNPQIKPTVARLPPCISIAG